MITEPRLLLGSLRRLAWFGLLLPIAAGGCSLRQLAVDGLGDTLSSGEMAFTTEDDLELVRASTPSTEGYLFRL